MACHTTYKQWFLHGARVQL
jgi:hypothetical protein